MVRWTTAHYVWLLVIIGGITFFGVLFHGYALDDFKQIVHNQSVHQLTSIPVFFTKSFLFAPKYHDITNYFYRPVFYSVYTLLYAVGNGNPFPFHLFQVTLYITNAVLLFLFFATVFKKPVAFALALLFLIHPDNEEVAAYAANIQDCLFFFFGMLALLVVQKKHIIKHRAWIVWLLLLFACLSKETGILFVVSVPLFLYLFRRDQYKRYILVSLATVCSYAALRLYASRAFFARMMTSYTHGSSSFHGRAAMIPNVVRYELKDLFYPLPNLPIKEILGVPIGVALLVIFFTLALILISGFIVYKVTPTRFPYFLFFAVWFGIGIAFHSQIIPLDVPLAKRWLYFPMVGMMGMLGILATMYMEQIASGKKFLIALFCIYLFFFSVETHLMNGYWTTVRTDTVLHPATTSSVTK